VGGDWDVKLVAPPPAPRRVEGPAPRRASWYDEADMTVELLIEAIVRQTTILIAQLATSGGARAPLSHVANQVFLELVQELERQGVSRKVSADMFGLGLRTYQRKIQRYLESSTARGRSLWVAVLDYVQRTDIVSRQDVLLQFAHDDEELVRGILHDLCESGLVSVSGTGARISYRATPEHELAELRQVQSHDGLDELLWALIYREGPLPMAELAKKHVDHAELERALTRLVEAGRVEVEGETYRARQLVLPLGSAVGWEAAVFDHFKAMVSTVLCRLSMARTSTLTDHVGGSTYTLDVWAGHPLEQEAYRLLGNLRAQIGEFRDKLEKYNADQGVPENYIQVLTYVGQCLIRQGSDDASS